LHSTSLKRCLLCWVFGLAMLPGVGSAQLSMIEDLSHRFEWSGQLQPDFRSEFETDTDGGDEFEAWRVGLSGDVGGPINESILVGFHARYQHSKYDFHLDGPAPGYGSNELPKDPWNDLNTIDLTPTATILVGSRASIVTAVPIRWSGEVGADRNAFIAGISAVASVQVTDYFRAGLGIGVSSKIEGDAETFPIFVLDWQINETLRLTTEGDWFQGGSTALYWGPNKALALSFSVGYERIRFRLDDNGTLPDTNGVGEVTAVPIEVGLRLLFPRGAHFDFRAGLAVDGRLRVEDPRGNKLYDQDFDPAPRISLSLRIPIGPSAASGRQPANPSR
jgi:hypothetical protein